jgi:hypothetical protein
VHSPIREAVPERRWVYPEDHLATIGPFIGGNQCDPRGAFTLSSDAWDAWPYATNAREALRHQTRLRFNELGSFLRPYAKWFCYERLQAGTSPRTLCRGLSMLTKADAIVLAMGAEALADIAPEQVSRNCGTAWPCHPICQPVNEPQRRYACRPTPARSSCGCRRTLENRLAFRGQ